MRIQIVNLTVDGHKQDRSNKITFTIDSPVLSKSIGFEITGFNEGDLLLNTGVDLGLDELKKEYGIFKGYLDTFCKEIEEGTSDRESLFSIYRDKLFCYVLLNFSNPEIRDFLNGLERQEINALKKIITANFSQNHVQIADSEDKIVEVVYLRVVEQLIVKAEINKMKKDGLNDPILDEHIELVDNCLKLALASLDPYLKNTDIKDGFKAKLEQFAIGNKDFGRDVSELIMNFDDWVQEGSGIEFALYDFSSGGYWDDVLPEQKETEQGLGKVTSNVLDARNDFSASLTIKGAIKPYDKNTSDAWTSPLDYLIEKASEKKVIGLTISDSLESDYSKNKLSNNIEFILNLTEGILEGEHKVLAMDPTSFLLPLQNHFKKYGKESDGIFSKLIPVIQNYVNGKCGEKNLRTILLLPGNDLTPAENRSIEFFERLRDIVKKTNSQAHFFYENPADGLSLVNSEGTDFNNAVNSLASEHKLLCIRTNFMPENDPIFNNAFNIRHFTFQEKEGHRTPILPEAYELTEDGLNTGHFNSVSIPLNPNDHFFKTIETLPATPLHHLLGKISFPIRGMRNQWNDHDINDFNSACATLAGDEPGLACYLLKNVVYDSLLITFESDDKEEEEIKPFAENTLSPVSRELINA